MPALVTTILVRLLLDALYDLEADIGETRNVAAAQPEIIARLTALMQRLIATGRSTPGAPQPVDAAVTWPVP